MKRKNGMSFEAHEQFGVVIATAKRSLQSWLMRLDDSYPMNGRELRALGKVLNAINGLKYTMDGAVFREHRAIPAEDAHRVAQELPAMFDPELAALMDATPPYDPVTGEEGSWVKDP